MPKIKLQKLSPAELSRRTTLVRLVLQALKTADGYSVPESTLVSDYTNSVKPPATQEDFDRVFLHIGQKQFAGFERDAATEERLFALKEKGANYLNRV